MKKGQSSSGIRFITWIFLSLNLLVVVLLLLSYLSYHISPDFIPYIAFTGLAYPYILVVNLTFIAFWVFTRPKYAIIPLLIVIAGWNHMGRLVQVSGNETMDDVNEKVKVISYNIQNFLKVNTSTTRYVTDFQNEANIIGFLQEENADIVCIQEMLNDRLDNKEFTDKLGEALNCPNYHYINYFSGNNQKLDAIAIFTRLPIINMGNLEYEEKSIGIYTDLILFEDTVRVYNLHLASIHFKQEDYEFWLDISPNQEQEKLKAGTSKIMSKIQAAFIKRSGQTDLLKGHLRSSPHPVIICGDFNDTPSSYSYNKLSTNMIDAFVESGTGLSSTYAGKHFPSFRIDFILYDPTYGSFGFERKKIPFSDHYPISTNLYKK